MSVQFVHDTRATERVAPPPPPGSGVLVLGPRTGSKTRSFSIPATLPPGPELQELLPIKVARVEARRPLDRETVTWQFSSGPRCVTRVRFSNLVWIVLESGWRGGGVLLLPNHFIC